MGSRSRIINLQNIIKERYPYYNIGYNEWRVNDAILKAVEVRLKIQVDADAASNLSH
jgi:hypothetical protein